jgi:hypothetical protein
MVTSYSGNGVLVLRAATAVSILAKMEVLDSEVFMVSCVCFTAEAQREDEVTEKWWRDRLKIQKLIFNLTSVFSSSLCVSVVLKGPDSPTTRRTCACS